MRTLFWLGLFAGCGSVSAAKDAAIGDGSGAPTPDAAPCQELAAECASANVLRVCSTVGQPPMDTTCGLGCSMDNSAHCRSLQPGFGLVADDLRPTDGLAEISMSATTTFNTNDGSITNLRTAGMGVIAGIDFSVRNGVGIFRFQKLTITGSNPAQSMSFVGANPVALVAITSIEATGTIFNAQGSCTNNAAGPGGIAGGGGGGLLTNGSPAPGSKGGKGGTADTQDGDFSGGGGGGGHAGTGGAGATVAGFAGGAGGQLDSVVAFTGGGGGGGGAGNEFSDGGSGGGGGGAIHIAANVLVKIEGGGIQAGGCGGNAVSGGSGGGGGAGGTIVIEAGDVELANATLAANGGGGGGTARGAHGLLGPGLASGGPAGSASGAGGAGSYSTAVNGSNAPASGGYGGGGGGAGGRIILRSSDGLITTGNAVFSPAATMNGTAPVN